MSELPAIQPFSGDSWDECSTLIHNVRNAAYREGKIRDKAWMADLASIHFMGEALAWYARLPEDVQEDWSKLQAALSNRWSAPESESRCTPCTCSSSPRPQDAVASEDVAAPNVEPGYLARGVLKAVVHGSDTIFFPQKAQDNSAFTLTENINQAARFRFESQSSSTLLEFVTTGWYQWVAMHWYPRTPNLGKGSTHYGLVSIVDPETMKSSIGWADPFQVLKFRVLSSGKLVPVWRDGKTETDLTAFAGGSNLHLVPDPEAYGKANSSHKRLTLYIQKIEE